MDESGIANPVSDDKDAMGISDEVQDSQIGAYRDRNIILLRKSRLVNYLQNGFEPWPICLDLTHPVFRIDRERLSNQVNDSVRDFFFPNVHAPGVPPILPLDGSLNAIPPNQKLSLMIVRQLTTNAMAMIESPAAVTSLSPQFVEECILFYYQNIIFSNSQCTVARSAMTLVTKISNLFEPFTEEMEYFIGMMTDRWCGEEFFENEAYSCLGFSHPSLIWITIFGLLSLIQNSIIEAFVEKNPFKILQIVSWLSKASLDYLGGHPIGHFLASDPTNWEGIICKLTMAMSHHPTLNQPDQKEQIDRLIIEKTDWRVSLIALIWLRSFDDRLPEWMYTLKPLKLNDGCVVTPGQELETPKHDYLSRKFAQALQNL